MWMISIYMDGWCHNSCLFMVSKGENAYLGLIKKVWHDNYDKNYGKGSILEIDVD